MDDFWQRVNDETLTRLNPWRAGNVKKIKGDVAFYPLSGADFINLYSIYPDCGKYFMIALEESGNIPEPLKQSPDKVHALLASIRRTVYHYGAFNYFQSKVMTAEMCTVSKTGNAPALMVFMARLGLKVARVEPVGIDPDGTIVPLDKDGRIWGSTPATRGMRYVFFTEDDRTPRTLVYLDMRLDADTIDPATASGKFFQKLDRVKTIMKSAVYLLHMMGFEAVRDLVISKSAMIVQDDSGIPYANLNNGEWDITLFGSYWPIYPITGCTVRNQEDLAAGFRKGALPLPFNFGYGSLLGKNKSNLIMAVRKKGKR